VNLPHISSELRRLGIIILVGVALRYAYVWFAVDLSRNYYWEYGEIAKNLHAGKGYSLFYFDGTQTAHSFNISATPCPSAHMPPGYVLFLWPFFFLGDVTLRNLLIISAQIAIAAGVSIVLYFFTEHFVRRGAGLLAAGIAASLPEFIYASASYTPTVIFHLGILSLLFVLQAGKQLPRGKMVLLLGLLSTILIYLRSEIALFVLAATFLVMKTIDFKTGIVVAGIILLMQLPWEIRNYAIFGEWVPLTTSGGLNFFRGHNEDGSAAWSDEAIEREASTIPFDAHYEPARSSLYFNRAFQFIREHPLDDLTSAGQKLVRFWIIDPDDRRSGTTLYVVPWLLILVLAVAGIVNQRTWVTHRPVALYLLCTTIVAMVFFVLPRYQTMMKVALVPFASSALFSLMNREWRDLSRRRMGHK
jgi:4-amino-4-deoxy-L-arabinose transferase-like glycosyltransferase